MALTVLFYVWKRQLCQWYGTALKKEYKIVSRPDCGTNEGCMGKDTKTSKMLNKPRCNVNINRTPEIKETGNRHLYVQFTEFIKFAIV